MIRCHIARTPNRKPRISRIFFYITHLLFFLIFSVAYAGEYHNSAWKGAPADNLTCSQCHTMHGSQGGVSMVYGGTAGGNIKLLRHATILQLCLYCHEGDNAGLNAPNVWSGTTKFTNHSAGLLCANDTSNPPCPTSTTNHTVGLTNVTPPGGTVTFSEFTCVNCHNPHGTKNYRNLRGGAGVTDSYGGVNFTGVDVSYKMGASLAAAPDYSVYINNTVNAGTGLTKYQTDQVTFRKVPANATTDGIQAFCKACHTDFHGLGDSTTTGNGMGGRNTGVGDDNTGTPWRRHPTMDVSMGEGQTNLHVADSTFWTTALPAWKPRIISGTPVAVTSEYPFCLSCHRAHGTDSTNNKHSNLIYGNPTSVGGTGTMMRDTCQQCHNQ